MQSVKVTVISFQGYLRMRKRWKAVAEAIRMGTTSQGWSRVRAATAAMDIPRVVENHRPRTAATTSAAVMPVDKSGLLRLAAPHLAAGCLRRRRLFVHERRDHLLEGLGGHELVEPGVFRVVADQAH